MTEEAASVPVIIARAIFAYAQIRGVAPETLAEEAGFELALLDDGDARTAASSAVRLWEVAARLADDESFGFHLGQSSHETAMPLAGRLIVASATLGEGLQRIMRHYRVFNDVHPAEIAVEPPHVVIRIHTKARGIALPRHAIEFAFAWFVGVAGRAVGEKIGLAGVSFEHAAPEDRSAHEAHFGCPITFDAPETAFRADPSLFARPNAAPDPALAEILESYAQNLHARLPPLASHVDRVRAVIAELLPRGGASVDLTAEALAMSSRTLQRKLRDEGTSFTDLVDSARCELAKKHLRERGASIAEIALLAGFSDQSTFHRAFVRWMGCTPGDFRRGAGTS